jgi:hypothetical protein
MVSAQGGASHEILGANQYQQRSSNSHAQMNHSFKNGPVRAFESSIYNGGRGTYPDNQLAFSNA